MKRFAVLAALGTAFVMGGSMAGAQQLADFNNYPATTPPNAVFASWSTPGAVTSNPTFWNTTATGYGSNYFQLYPTVIDISGSSTLELDTTVNSGTAGFLVDLNDGEGDEWQYALGFGFGPGSYSLQQPLNSPSGILAGPGTFDFTSIVAYHLELDPGATNGSANSYNVDWHNLSAVNVPEPASFGLGALGCLFFAGRRRR
jgi:hypothetical protein